MFFCRARAVELMFGVTRCLRRTSGLRGAGRTVGGYPSRAIRTHRWLYIVNYEADRWPAGDPDFDAEPEGIYGDINAGPTKSYPGRDQNYSVFFEKIRKDLWSHYRDKC